MKRIGITFFLSLTLLMATAVSAYALDYTFEPEDSSDYYSSTLYEDIYGSQYNYGGTNIIDFYEPTSVDYTPSTAPTSVSQPGTTTPTYDVSVSYPELWKDISIPQISYTDYSSLVRSDGSIGTLKIPKLGITVKAYEGATTDSMKNGVGHFDNTSAWNGNIGICGHNRGAKYNIGTIKDLKIGDTITYTTSLGTRTYAVSYVGQISALDWSRLNATADNRITIITCLANQPSLRVCVQAKEII